MRSTKRVCGCGRSEGAAESLVRVGRQERFFWPRRGKQNDGRRARGIPACRQAGFGPQGGRPFDALRASLGKQNDGAELVEVGAEEAAEAVLEEMRDHAGTQTAAPIGEQAEHHAEHGDDQHEFPALISVTRAEH